MAEHHQPAPASMKWWLLALPLLVLTVGVLLWRDPAPVSANPLTGMTAVTAGSSHTCAVSEEGAMKCWGANHIGQLGDGTILERTRPVDVAGLPSGVAAIAAGGSHTCALTTDGDLQCWGANFYGQLGNGTSGRDPQSTPVPVLGLDGGAKAVAAGDMHTCAVTAAGGVRCWGLNDSGQLGAATSEACEFYPPPVPCSSVPIDVDGLSSDVIAVAAGTVHACALTSAGAVRCWGDNRSGQLGDGTTTNRPAPVAVAGLGSGVVAITAGGDHTCALTETSGVKCWGSNTAGQLGAPATEECVAFGFAHACSTTPVDVSGGIQAIDAGAAHTCALTLGSGVVCWGANYDGQLGDGTTTDRMSLNAFALSGGAAAVTAGTPHTCALLTGGGVKCWGANWAGQLGDGTTERRTTPVDVVGVEKPPPTPVLPPGAVGACAPARPHDAGAFDLTIRTSDGHVRDYLLRIPPSYSGADALPLVFYLHGTRGTTHEVDYSGLPEKAGEAGFILVSPQGVPNALVPANHWNFNLLEDRVDHTAPDDLAFIAELLDALESELCIDTARVYATGHSSGGLMSSRLGCSLGDRFAAVAPSSGVYFPPFASELWFEDECTSPRPVPIIAFHGTADPCIVFEGGLLECGEDYEGSNLHLRSVEDEIMPDWAAYNGCDSTPTVELPRDDLHVVRYGGCDLDADVVLYAFEDGPHTWYERYPPWEEISSVDLMWEFFQAHPLRSAQPAAATPTPATNNGQAPTATSEVLDVGLPDTGSGGGGASPAGWVLALGAAGAALVGAAWYVRRLVARR